MSDKIYDRLPFEVAHVLLIVEQWRGNVNDGLPACADNDLSNLLEAAGKLEEWKLRQVRANRLSVQPDPGMEQTRTLLAGVRKRMEAKSVPRLRIVPIKRDE